MAQSLVILGTGSNALDILDVVEAINRWQPMWQIVGFLDDSRAVGSRYEEYPILGGVRDAPRHAGSLFLNAIGGERSYRKRPDVVVQSKIEQDQFATLIHPLASVSRRAVVGCGSCINAGVVVAGGVTIGSHVWLAAGCSIGAGTTIGDHTMIAAGAVIGSSVRVETTAYISGGASVRQRVTIGERASVGLGGVVIADVEPRTTVVGNPARVLVRPPRSGTVGDSQILPGLPDPPGQTGEE